MFPERMLQLMKDRKITKKQISTDLNFGINQIKYWEKNNNVPSADVLHEIAVYLGTTVEYLIEESEEKSPAGEPELREASEYLSQIVEDIMVLDEEGQKELKHYLTYLISKQKND